eukprot:COSAG03_NODE_876_length_5528_cov_8.710260_1_plen_145_part_00
MYKWSVAIQNVPSKCSTKTHICIRGRYLHACRVVHRDVKPDNILLSPLSASEMQRRRRRAHGSAGAKQQQLLRTTIIMRHIFVTYGCKGPCVCACLLASLLPSPSLSPSLSLSLSLSCTLCTEQVPGYARGHRLCDAPGSNTIR